MQTKTEQKKEAIMNGIAHSKESEEAWEELLAREDEHDPVEDDVTIDTIYRLVCKLRDIADGEDTAEAIRKPADTAQLVKAINEDNYRAWEVVGIPFDGHATHHHISNDNDYMPIDGVIEDIRKTANECASLERNNEADRKITFRCLDRAKRMLSWLEPTAEDYYGVPPYQGRCQADSGRDRPPYRRGEERAWRVEGRLHWTGGHCLQVIP